MSQSFWTYAFVILTFGLYIGIALKTRAGSTEEFYVAGHDVPPAINGMATAADWMSAASFLSMAGLIAFLGYGGSVYLMAGRAGTCSLHCCSRPSCESSGNSPSRTLSGTAITAVPPASSP
jgi:Na+(H+)/acetate symporter ActP